MTSFMDDPLKTLIITRISNCEPHLEAYITENCVCKLQQLSLSVIYEILLTNKKYTRTNVIHYSRGLITPKSIVPIARTTSPTDNYPQRGIGHNLNCTTLTHWE